jgi:hypothetical protein
MLDDLLSSAGIDRPLDADRLRRVIDLAGERGVLRPVLVDLAAEGAPVEAELVEVQRLRELTAADEARVVSLLDDAGVRGARSLPLPVEDELRRLVRLRVPDMNVASRVVCVLETDGMRRSGPTSEAAWRFFRRTNGSVTLTCSDHRPTQVEIIWRTRVEVTSGRRARIRRVFVPDQADFDAVTLPARLWPLYALVRPFRLVSTRSARLRRSASGAEPGRS